MATRNINLKVHDESDIFSSFDPDQNMLSDEIVAYLARVFLNKHRTLRENFILPVVSDTSIDEERVINAICGEAEQQKDDTPA